MRCVPLLAALALLVVSCAADNSDEATRSDRGLLDVWNPQPASVTPSAEAETEEAADQTTMAVQDTSVEKESVNTPDAALPDSEGKPKEVHPLEDESASESFQPTPSDDSTSTVPNGLESTYVRFLEYSIPVGDLSDGQFIFTRVEYAIPGLAEKAWLVVLIRPQGARLVTLDELRAANVRLSITNPDPSLAFDNSAFSVSLQSGDLALDGRPHVAILQGFAKTQSEIAGAFDHFGFRWEDFVPGPYYLGEPEAIAIVWLNGQRVLFGPKGLLTDPIFSGD